MEIKKGDKLKVGVPDLDQGKWDKLWNGVKLKVEEVTVERIVDYNDGYCKFVFFKLHGEEEVKMTANELRNAMRFADPNVFASEVESFNL